jgi:hypothetical protein
VTGLQPTPNVTCSIHSRAGAKNQTLSLIDPGPITTTSSDAAGFPVFSDSTAYQFLCDPRNASGCMQPTVFWSSPCMPCDSGHTGFDCSISATNG